MQNTVKYFIDQLRANQIRRRKLLSIICVLSLLVAADVFWRLRITGITMSDEACCGKIEHHHSEACGKERRLICGFDEEAPEIPAELPDGGAEVSCSLEEHTHTDACYTTERVLVCEASHEHTEGCYTQERVLVCVEDHEHEDTCYELQDCLTCDWSHTHNDACWREEQVLTCTQEEHIHNESCGDSLEAAAAPAPHHVHTDACYETVYLCGLQEHTHTLACYSDPDADLETAADWEGTLPDSLSGDWAEDLIAVAQSQLGYQESTYNFILTEDGEDIRGYTRYGAWYGNPYGDWNAMFTAFCLQYAGIEQDVLPYNSGCRAWAVQLERRGLLLWPDDCTPEPGDLVFFDRDGDSGTDCVGILTDMEEQDGQTNLTTIEGDLNDCVDTSVYSLDDDTIFAYVHIADISEVGEEVVDSGEELPAEEPPLPETTTLPVLLYKDALYEVPTDSGVKMTVSGALPENACVKAYPADVVLPDGEVLWAFDIAVFTENGDVWEPEDETLTVSVQLPQPYGETDKTPAIYYVSEDGTGEEVPSQLNGERLTFDAEHFSVYALVMLPEPEPFAGTLVYNETDMKNAFAADANIRLAADFTVNETINITGDRTLDLNGYTLTANGTLFNIAGGSLTILDSAAASGTENFTYTVTETEVIDEKTGATTESSKEYTVHIAGRIIGGSGPVVNLSGGTFTLESGALCNGTGRAINMSGGTANLAGGYIYGFQKTGTVNATDDNFGGAVLASGGTLNISGAVLAKNEALNGGAIYANNATVNITGGVITENKSTRASGNWGDHSEGAAYRCGGGGIFCNGNTTLTMSGGYITNNTAVDDYYFDGGGGVLISGTTTFTLDGGYITGNEAAGGGGIRSDWSRATTFTMNGGFVSGNTARSAEGGGIAITNGGTGEINDGYITNNRIINTVHWGGGGLFCSDGAYLRVYHVLITDNDAGGFGGGVAGCSTGRVYICVKDGGAIYANSAAGKNLSGGGSQKNEDHAYAADSPVFMENGYKDYFCALNSLVEGGMLGDGTANWSGSLDGVAIQNVAKDAILEAAYVMGLTSAPSDADITNAQKQAEVFINGNSSYTHGGGILCNGYLLVGDKNPIAVGSRLKLEGSKKLIQNGSTISLDGYEFTFQVTDEAGNVVSIGTSDASGNINFDRLLSFTEELCKDKVLKDGDTADFVYDLTELPSSEHPEIAPDGTIYRITVTIGRESQDTPFVDENGQTIKRVRYIINGITVRKSTDQGSTWGDVAYTYTRAENETKSASLKITNGTTFTNEKGATTSLTVKKKWVGTDSMPDSITVDLLRDGVVMDGMSVTLSEKNGWTHTWTNLAKGPTYTVYEHPVPGYETDYDYIAGDNGSYWVPMEPGDSLTVGEQYLIVNGAGDQALYITTNHQNNGFDTSDKRAVVLQTGTKEVGGKTYNRWYNAADIDPRSVFTAQQESKNNHPGIILKCDGTSANTWLLVQDANNNHFKGTSGANYASFFTCENGVLKGQENYGWNPNELRTVIYADSKFNTSTGSESAAQVYHLVSGNSGGNVITIVNTRTEDTYGLDLTKVDANDNTVTLPGAVFQLLQNETALTFRLEDGRYVYDKAGAATDLTTGADGKLSIVGLPEGTYILRETQAPDGYTLAEDRTLVFPSETGEDNTLELTVEDAKLSYTLPETGGPGQMPFVIGGLLLMAAALFGVCGLRRKRERRAID